MKKICVYFISVLLCSGAVTSRAQDTIPFPMKINLGADLFGPTYYIFDKDILSIEGFISIDIDSNKAIVAEAGYLDYKYSQYNFDYLSKGGFLKLGIDFNLIKPEISHNRYYAGIGLRYGAGLFESETPFLSHENYWGITEGSIPASTHLAHYLEVTPGIRAELFRNLSIGWTVRLRFLLYSGTGVDNKPLYIPGFGNGTKTFSPGINYYIVWSIPYKKGK